MRPREPDVAADRSRQSEQATAPHGPARPEGDGEELQRAGRHWQGLVEDIRWAFDTIHQAIHVLQWSGDARRAFDNAWSQFSDHGTRAWQLAEEVGDHLVILGYQIQDHQYAYDLASKTSGTDYASLAQAVRIMDEARATLDSRVDAAVQMLAEAAYIAIHLAQSLTWELHILVVLADRACRVQQSTSDTVFSVTSVATGSSGSGLNTGPITSDGMATNVLHETSTSLPREVLTPDPNTVRTDPATDRVAQGLEGTAANAPVSIGEGVLLLAGALAAAGMAGVALVAAERASDGGRTTDETGTTLDESARRFSELEHSIAEILHSEGSQVTAVAESSDRTPSALVDGRHAAFKALGPGATDQTVRNALNSVKGQAGNIVVGARGSGLTEAEAVAGLKHFLGTHPAGVSQVRIIGDGFDLTFPPRSAK
jgi:Contact-dependent growth inhibition CdiA C-terminal domain